MAQADQTQCKLTTEPEVTWKDESKSLGFDRGSARGGSCLTPNPALLQYEDRVCEHQSGCQTNYEQMYRFLPSNINPHQLAIEINLDANRTRPRGYSWKDSGRESRLLSSATPRPLHRTISDELS